MRAIACAVVALALASCSTFVSSLAFLALAARALGDLLPPSAIVIDAGSTQFVRAA
jgi:hypothetical protein